MTKTIQALDGAEGTNFQMYQGDSAEVLRQFEADSVHFSIYSPPFSSLFVYGASPRDIGNVRNDAEFFEHYAYLAKEQFRTLMPGRLMAVHCMMLPTSKERDGFIGLRDFRGDIIRMYQKHGFVFHSEVTIWKDPVVAQQRTKALGLLYKQLRKDSAMSRQGIPDYLIVLRKPGVNPEPVTHTPEEFPLPEWQKLASPVWDRESEPVWDRGMPVQVWSDINQSDTLQYRSAREQDDERHICPLQLEVIRRAVRLWTNPNDVVLSPFAGIGSEGYVALQEGRRFVGVELKRSYYEQAVRNLRSVDAGTKTQPGLFDAAQV